MVLTDQQTPTEPCDVTPRSTDVAEYTTPRLDEQVKMVGLPTTDVEPNTSTAKIVSWSSEQFSPEINLTHSKDHIDILVEMESTPTIDPS